MLEEADRCLYNGGKIMIAEHNNQLNNRLSELREVIKSLGTGYVETRYETIGQFTFIEAEKL